MKHKFVICAEEPTIELQLSIIHWWVLRRMIKNFFISIALFFVVRLNKALTAINNRITKKIY